MRKIFLFMMVSLDGYFEGTGHDISWHNVDAEFNAFAHEQNNQLDTVLFGRRTYDLMASFWPTPEGMRDDDATAQWMMRAKKVVVSEPFEPTWENTTVVSGNVADEIRKLKEEPGTDIALLGSNMLCVSLMEAGLVDEFRLMVNPIAIGNGTPLFSGLSKPHALTLIDSRTFANGNVLNRYAN
ncbi:MAG TPA: dihydrofolate reductase family protein [Candidatus Paceibacterota bacterium]|nr:dihydrofolate reductase family protein [Candidatus Paceibacterota bacterium]